MKKYLIVLAAAVVALASCKTESGSKYTKISFKESEISIAIDESKRLVLLWEPSEIAEAPAVEWASSNPAVATVSDGTVKGIAAGQATITAKAGELTAVCNVYVKGMYDLVEWNGATWWAAADKTPLTNDTIKTVISYNGGTEVSCVPCKVYCRIWGDGLYYGAEGMQGEGFDAFNVGMGLLITDDLGKGPNYYILGADVIYFVDAAKFDWTDTAFLFCCPTGQINGTAEQWYSYLTGESEDSPVSGSIMEIYNADEQKTPDGFVAYFGEGVWVGDEEAVVYANAELNWFDGPFNEETPSYYGILLQYVEEEEGWDWSDPKTWAPVVTTRYNFDYREEEEEAPKYYLAPADRELPASLQKHVSDPKVLIKK